MTPTQHIYHTDPLVQLVKAKLHHDKPLANMVRAMRARRWRDSLPKNVPVVEPESSETK